ncbi:outer-membrane receptor for ferric coprogen and ferric-rhodotorulic acid [Sphingomonas gellani]|uniref:Outer-membrane receptor for ferric coprogen and ferric-rhodotorulic acid n=1 Tax=Sphingomonas gellani TaxID=1166340 RepID=A0A1H7ZE62_9SPHN|nr:TonB-dependent siderophore receptor [Sphingomonas gellani]SEM56832.1 outer-membrane receptor for ferric coprogen and ferric-rhodotorulic acid [Sphingomonas gellani]
MTLGAATAALCAGAANAQIIDTGSDASSQTRGGEPDIVVVGKSYGNSVGKTLTPLKDVPNTITVVDRERFEAQNLFTLEDALTATNGVTVTGIGSEDASFISRGFTINNYLIDGVPTLSFGFPGVVPDLFFYDRVEVLRGPAGLFSGSGNPAGSINLVRKRPLDTAKMQASAGYGSYDNLRLELDASTPIGQRAGLRVGLMAQDQDQFFEVAHRNRVDAYAVADLEIGERTTLTVGANYDRFRPAIQSGLPGIIGGLDGSEGRLLDVDRSTYLGADWNRFSSETYSAFVELAHRISDRWTLRATGLLVDVDRIDLYSYIGNQPVTPTNGLTTQIAFRGDNHQKTRSFDFNGVGSFPLFGRDQTLILGADYQASDYDSYFNRLNGFARIDVYNPVSPAEPVLVKGGQGATNTQVEQYGLYGQMRLSPIEGLTLVGGGRLTWWDTDVTTLLPKPLAPVGYTIENRLTPYGGIVWDVTPALNVYASYADSFTPQAAPAGRRRPDGDQIKPLIGDQFEVGTKLALMNDRLLLSLAGYRINQTNRLFNDPNLADIVLQIGKVRAEGIEAEANGEILPGWRINGGYTYTKTRYLEDANAQFEGLPLVPVVPRHMGKLFTNYTVQGGALAGASIGGGATVFSSTYGGNPAVFRADGTVATRSTIVRQGSYAVFDLRAGYRLNDGLSLSVNVNNLFDKTYYARLSSTGRGNYFGSPRTVFATLRYSLS